MNKVVMDHLMRKMRDNRDNRDRRDYGDYGDERRGRDRRDNRDNRDNRDYGDYGDYGDSRDNRDNRDYDERRGVRGSGRGRDRRDMRDYDERRRDYDYDERDYHNKLKLSKSEIMDWEDMLKNADGTKGPHFNMEKVMHAAEKLGVKFDEFSEKEFCMTMNMMYSDYCRTIKKYVSNEDELLMMCACLALDFLEDEDAPGPSEKLTMYFHCIANLK